MATKNPLKDKKILVTCGPTWVAIDAVRVISNRSSGELGHHIAQLLTKQGARVTLLEGPTTHILENKKIERIKFNFYDDLRNLMEKELRKKYSAVIHAAAVSDYRPINTYGTKLSSNFAQIQLQLEPTQKIIERIRPIRPKIFLVGFKLEARIDQPVLLERAHNLLKKTNCDLVVATSIVNDSYSAYIIDKKKNILAQDTTRKNIAKKLVNILKRSL